MTTEIDYEHLPHPEDLSLDSEYALVGLYMQIERAYCQLSQTITHAVRSGLDWSDGGAAVWVNPAVRRESLMEQWLDNALYFMPQWYFASTEE